MNKIENAELSDRAVNQISDVIIPMIKERDKEIERLNRTNNEIFKANKTLVEEIKKLQNQLQQKESIIKEVREKLCKYGLVDKEGNFNAYLDTIELKELLEILDKEVN